MNDAGWVKIHRKILNNEIWRERPYSKGQAMIDLILRADYTDENKGQFTINFRELSLNWGWSLGKVQRFFNHLTSVTFLTKTTPKLQSKNRYKNGYTYVIEKYSTYQDTRYKNGSEIDTREKSDNLLSYKERIKEYIRELFLNEIVFIDGDYSDITEEVRDKYLEFIDFSEMVLQKPVRSETAVRRHIKDLEELQASGNDPRDVIQQSIEREWRMFFKIKKGQ